MIQKHSYYINYGFILDLPVILFYFIFLVISQPELGDVFRLLEQRSHDWRKIGRGLNVKYDFCQNLLEQGVMTSNEDKLKAVLNNWIEARCSEVSWDNLIQVLTELELNGVVYDVRSFLRTETGIRKYNFTRMHVSYINGIC